MVRIISDKLNIFKEIETRLHGVEDERAIAEQKNTIETEHS